MFSFLLSLASSFDQRYSITAPIELTNVSEIGNWTFRGSTIPLKKKFIRLTSSNLDEYGLICQRVPTLFQDWNIEIEISVKDGKAGGDFFEFLFSEELCPSAPVQYRGVLVYINTSDIDSDGKSQILVFPNDNNYFDYGKGLDGGRIKVRNQDEPVRIIFKREDDQFSGFSHEGTKEVLLFNYQIKNLIKHGYFSIYALSGEKGDIHDLYSFMTYPREYDMPEYSYDISYRNRKIIEENVLQRREMKEKRRAKMQVSGKYTADSIDHQRKLYGSEGNIKDAFLEVNEAARRSQDTVTATDLKQFINQKVLPSIKKAAEKTEIEFIEFSNIQSHIKEIWENLQNQLRDLVFSTQREMKQMGDEVLGNAQKVSLGEMKVETVVTETEKKNKEQSNIVQKILIFIMIIELIGYITFFLIMKRKTHGFVKID